VAIAMILGSNDDLPSRRGGWHPATVPRALKAA
jgi:hypothetical protein